MRKLLKISVVFFSVLFAFSASAATIYVNSSTGNDTTGSGTSGSPYATFHKGYTSASSGDTINLTGTFDWNNSGETGDSTTSGYTISKDITIQGQGADQTIIQATSTDNTASKRVFTIPVANTVTINDVTIRYGKVGASQYGGNIDVVGTAIIDSCDISYGRATDGGGGGVNVWGKLTISNSTVHHNVASYMGGGLNRHYYISGNGTPTGAHTMDIINTTVSSNTVTQTVAYLEGGGVFYRRGEGSITNSTITKNQVTGGTGASTHGVGTGDGAGTIQLKNNIIAGNTIGSNGGDIGHRENGYGVYADNGGNIIGRRGFYSGGFTPAATTWMDSTTYNGTADGTYVLQNGLGTSSGTLNLDSALASNSTLNGTQTFAITSASSIAINNGLTGSNGATTTVPSLDQRGGSRSGLTDIGSYEYGATLGDTTAPTVSLTAPTSGQTVAGSISVSATASDDVSVAGVKFYIDGTLQGSEDTTSTYGISWDSTSTSTGSHSAFAVARDSSNNYATSSSVSFNVDNTTPGFSILSASSTLHGAVITWVSDSETSSQVNFGLSSSYGSSTPESDTSTRVTNHSVTVSGLPSCARFNYQAQGKNAALTTATSSNATFRTAGCTGNASVSSTNDGSISTASGGTVSQGNLTLTIPTSFTGTSSSAVFQAHQLDGSAFFSTAGTPSGKTRAGDTVYNLKALTDATTTLSTFSSALTVTMSYTDEDIDGIDESTLLIYRYDGSDWNSLSSCTVDTSAKTVTCQTTAFSDFAIFGDEVETNSSSEGSSSVSGTSISRQINNLIAMGQYENAKKIAENYKINPPVIPAVLNSDVVSTASTVNNFSSFSFGRDLSLGDTGDDVKKLQDFLIIQNKTASARELFRVGSTGYFGQYTKNALGDYQKYVGIKPYQGYFGPLTRNHIKISSQ